MRDDGYLRGVLADATRPFQHRARVRTLLGLPDDTGVAVMFTPTVFRTGFSYLHDFRAVGQPAPTGPVVVHEVDLGRVVEELSAEPSFPDWPESANTRPSGHQSTVDQPGRVADAGSGAAGLPARSPRAGGRPPFAADVAVSPMPADVIAPQAAEVVVPPAVPEDRGRAGRAPMVGGGARSRTIPANVRRGTLPAVTESGRVTSPVSRPVDSGPALSRDPATTTPKVDGPRVSESTAGWRRAVPGPEAGQPGRLRVIGPPDGAPKAGGHNRSPGEFANPGSGAGLAGSPRGRVARPAPEPSGRTGAPLRGRPTPEAPAHASMPRIVAGSDKSDVDSQVAELPYRRVTTTGPTSISTLAPESPAPSPTPMPQPPPQVVVVRETAPPVNAVAYWERRHLSRLQTGILR